MVPPPPHPAGVLLNALASRRNGLLRGSDRLEVMVLAAALIFAPMAPVLGVIVGQQVFAMASAESAEQAAGAHRTVAVLTEDASPPAVTAFGSVITDSLVTAAWAAPDGRIRTGRIMVVAGMRAGQTLPVWTDPGGTLVPAPDSPGQQRIGAAIIGATAALCWLILLAGGVTFARWMLDRRRLRTWGLEWAAVEHQWRRELL